MAIPGLLMSQIFVASLGNGPSRNKGARVFGQRTCCGCRPAAADGGPACQVWHFAQYHPGNNVGLPVAGCAAGVARADPTNKSLESLQTNTIGAS